MIKPRNISLVFIVQLLFLNATLFSQTSRKLTIGLTENAGSSEVDFSLNVGLHYKKHYSQVNIVKCVGISATSFGFWQADPNILKTAGLGFTQRYFPNKIHSRFAGFFHGDFLFSNYSAITTDTLFIIEKSYQRRLLGITAGYGMTLNFLHHFTLLTSIDFGGNLIWGKDQFYNYNPNYINVFNRKNFVSTSQMKFSILYSLKRF